MYYLKRFIIFCFLSLSICFSQNKSDTLNPKEILLQGMHSISSHTLFDYVKILASEKYSGRLTGTPGYDSAAAWAIAHFINSGIKPKGDNNTYLQSFPNPYTLVLEEGLIYMQIPLGKNGKIKKYYKYEDDFFPGSTSDSGTVTAEVIYAGYGITAPELNYDDYKNIDVKNKIVMFEPEVPVSPDKDPELFKKWRPYSFHNYKMKNAKEHGAAGVVYNYHITNPNCVFIKNLVYIAIGENVTNDIFTGTQKDHRETVKKIKSELKPTSFSTGKTMTISCKNEFHPEGIGSNVIGFLAGSDPVLSKEFIIIGSHLDHLGRNHLLMPGANDNASACAVLLGAAEALAKYNIPLKRSILFILFGAEEQGVKGSEYYVNHPVVPNNSVKAFINLESVGIGEKISMGAGKNYPSLAEVFERNNEKYIHRFLSSSFTANLARPRQDAAHFLWANIPSLSFGTYDGPDFPFPIYHTTKDSPDIITPEIMEDLARLVYLSVIDFANKE